MKTITIPYEEYLEMEKCKKVIEEMKERITIGIGYEIYTNPDSHNEHITLYDCDEIFKALLGEDKSYHVVHLEVWKG